MEINCYENGLGGWEDSREESWDVFWYSGVGKGFGGDSEDVSFFRFRWGVCIKRFLVVCYDDF